MRRTGWLVVALAAALVLTAAASARPDAGDQQPARSPLTVVDIRREPMPLPPGWEAPQEGHRATFTAPYGTAQYSFPLPRTIPATGATAEIQLIAAAPVGSRFAPGLGISGDVEIVGAPWTLNVTAESGRTETVKKQLKIIPKTYEPGEIVDVVISTQEGLRVVYRYKAGERATPVRVDFRGSWTSGRGAAAKIARLEIAGGAGFTIPSRGGPRVSSNANVIKSGVIRVDLHGKNGAVGHAELRVVRAHYTRTLKFDGDRHFEEREVDLVGQVRSSSNSPCLSVGKRVTFEIERSDRGRQKVFFSLCKVRIFDFADERVSVAVKGP